MADIRIKDLTTLESASLTGDVFVIDGTTGTRKLSAFSPTFGGNATVTGTLTVSGATGSLGSSASAATSLKLTVGVGTNASPKYRTIDFRNYDDSKSQAYIRAANRETDSNASTIEVAARSSGDVLTSIATFSDSQLSIAATTASTTTSSGALVVSGGVGVAGNINGGGDITLATNTKAFYNLNYATAKGLTAGFFSRGTNGGWGSGIHFYSSNTDYSATFAHDPGNGDLHLYTTSSASNYTSSEIALTATAAKQIKVLATTASTTTSSGALVVSGGVGVAGAIVTGGIVRCGGTNGLSLGSDTGNIRIDSAGPAGVEFRGLSAADTITGFTMREMALIDGTTAPSTRAGYATIYVDSADGDLKVKFGDGTVKTIATDS